jgi:cyanophycinase
MATGTLIAHGGGTTGAETTRRFISLAGGSDAPLVVLGQVSEDATAKGERSAEWLRENGAKSVFVARTEDIPSLENALKTAQGVWIPGGDQNRLLARFAGSRVIEGVREVYRRGGCVGGSSAGAALLGARMPTGEGDLTKFEPGSSEAGDALGLLSNALFDTHLFVRQRTQRLANMVLTEPELIGIGIDENAWVELRGRRLTVQGGSALLMRARSKTELSLRWLRAGEAARV